jgi:YbbR domain-containing protein
MWLKQIIRKVFLEDWVMKLVALAITLALWLGVTGLSKPTTLRLTAIPLDVRYSNNIEITNTPINAINFVITGDSRKVSQIKAGDLAATIDISEVPPGDRVIPLTPETVYIFPLPPGVKVEDIQPRSFAVRIETVEIKEVPVSVETSGQLPSGFEIYDTVATPSRVSVRGPSGFIRSLGAASTERIDISGRTTDFTARQIPLNVTNPKSTVVSENAVVEVTFKIGEQRVERVFHVPVGDSTGRHADVKLFGGKSLLQNLRGADLKIEVDGNGDDDDTARVILPAALDGKVEIRKVDLR